MKQRAFNDREGTVGESGADGFAVSFLYNTVPGRVLLKLLVRKTVSELAGSVLKSPVSCVFINGFVKRNNINMEEYREVKFKSFNDFFIREIKEGFRPFPDSENEAAAPCDGKLSAYPITADSYFYIKNSIYTLDSLLQDGNLASEFADGLCLIFRLTPDDYHRYSYIDDGEILSHKRIKGKLHTVRPIAHQRFNVYSQNSREYTVMQTRNFSKVVQIEVGALFVGRITNHASDGAVKRGFEKGMFQFGGSTIVLLFKKDSIAIDEAIFENTSRNKETVVRMGRRIGEKTITGSEVRQ